MYCCTRTSWGRVSHNVIVGLLHPHRTATQGVFQNPLCSIALDRLKDVFKFVARVRRHQRMNVIGHDDIVSGI